MAERPLEVFGTRYADGRFAGPSQRGFVHVAAQVSATHPGPIFRRSPAHVALLARLKELAGAVRAVDGVDAVTVLDAIVVAPPGEYEGDWGAEVRPPHFDVVVLVEARSPEAARAARDAAPFRALLAAVEGAAKRTHVVVARDERRLADVEKRAGGLFVSQYFVAADPAALPRVWEHVTRFHEVETGLENGVLLVPEPGERTDYPAIDLARWDVGLPTFVWRQVRNARGWTTLRAGLHANRVGAMAILYRMA